MDAVAETMCVPGYVTQPNGNRQLLRFSKTIDGVQVRVNAYKDNGRYVIDTAYPIGGDGVVRNTENGRIPVKPSRSKEWREESR